MRAELRGCIARAENEHERRSLRSQARRRWGRRLEYAVDLLFALVGRDLKLRYRRSVLGALWALLNPLAQLIVFAFLFRGVLGLRIPGYPLFVFTGVLAWNWFRDGLLLAVGAFTQHRELVQQPGFPNALLPVTVVITSSIDFLVALPLLLLFVLLAGGKLTNALWALPMVFLLQFALILGLGWWLATLQVAFRDTGHLLGVVLMLLFFLTPVFYEASMIPVAYQWAYGLNPMVHLIAAYRAILIQGSAPDARVLCALGLCLGVLAGAGYVTAVRASARFVDEL